MKPLLTHAARALVDTACTCEERDCAALAEAAIDYLKRCGCSHADLRTFARAVEVGLRRSPLLSTVHFTTPTGTSTEHTEKIADALGKALGGRVTLEEFADEKLIGGATISYGDERFDASLKGALERLQTQLTAA